MNKPAIVFAILQTGARANGGVQSITNIMFGLGRFRPIVLTNIETDQVESWRQSGIEVHVVPERAPDGLRSNPRGYLSTYMSYHVALRKILADTGARVVHANDPLAFQLAISAAKSRKGAKIAMNLRDTLDPDRPVPRLKYKMLFAAADHVFYLSEDMAERWAEVAPNAKRSYTVTYSVVDLRRFVPAPSAAADPPVVLISGIIRPKKGQLEFLRYVAPQLARQGIETWIAGDFNPTTSPYDAACADAAKPLGNAVRFLGYRKDLPELFARATVVAIASRHEGLVRSMIEAMSCGRPVVSFAISSAREILEEISGGAGIVVEPGDYRSMAKAIEQFCREPSLAARAGEVGAETARKLFNADDVVRRYEDAYATLLN